MGPFPRPAFLDSAQSEYLRTKRLCPFCRTGMLRGGPRMFRGQNFMCMDCHAGITIVIYDRKIVFAHVSEIVAPESFTKELLSDIVPPLQPGVVDGPYCGARAASHEFRMLIVP